MFILEHRLENDLLFWGTTGFISQKNPFAFLYAEQGRLKIRKKHKKNDYTGRGLSKKTNSFADALKKSHIQIVLR